MIAAILIGRKGSIGFPGKNTYKVLNNPLCYYPYKAAKDTNLIDSFYCSTDCSKLKDFSKKNNINIIKRPKYLATSESNPEEVFLHAYQKIKSDFPNKNIELLVLLMANCVTITKNKIIEGIDTLNKNKNYDSAVTVSNYNSYSPHRARKINKNGLLEPFLPFTQFSDLPKVKADRNSLGDTWFADMGVSIVRPNCLINWRKGLLPQRWMGENIYPLKQTGGFDIDYEYEIPMLEHWLKTFGNL